MPRLPTAGLARAATWAACCVSSFLASAAWAEEGPRQLVDSPLSTANIIDTAVGLVIVLVVMLGLAWLYRRFVQVPGAVHGQIQVLGGVSLGTREKAVLLSVHGRRVLVGVAPGRVQALMTLDDDQNPDNATVGLAKDPEFDQQLQAATKERLGEAAT